MRKYKKVATRKVSDIVCDVCGRSCMSACSMGDPLMAEYAVLEATWGYCSRKDGESYKCEMCEECFGRVSAFIDSIKGSPGTS